MSNDEVCILREDLLEVMKIASKYCKYISIGCILEKKKKGQDDE
jgi:hypothetical protein